MRPSDRTIRDELRREAAKAQIPDDMWQNINRRLDQDAAQRERRWQWLLRGAQWRPAMVLAVAAGFFWFALIPALPNMDNASVPTRSQGTETAVRSQIDPGNRGQHTTQPADEPETKKTPTGTSSSVAIKPYLHFPTVPQ